MKLKRLLQNVETFLSAEKRERRSRKKEMRKILNELKKKERKLKAEIEAESDAEERARLEGKLRVAHAQRRKGVAALKALKDGGAAKADRPPSRAEDEPAPGEAPERGPAEQ